MRPGGGFGVNSAFALLDFADEDGDVDVAQLPEAERKAAQQQQQRPAAAPKRPPAAAGTDSAAAASVAAAAAASAASVQPNKLHKVSVEDYYKAFQHVFRDPATGDAVLRFHRTDIVRVRQSGEVVLCAGGWFTPTVLASLNDGLNPLGIRVSARGAASDGAWAVTDDSGATEPFAEFMRLPPRSAEHRGRAGKMLGAYSGGVELPRYVLKSAAFGGGAAPAALPPPQRPRPQAAAAAAAVCITAPGAAAPAQQPLRGAGPATYQQQYQQQQQKRGAAAANGLSVEQQFAAAVAHLGIEDEVVGGDDHLCVVCLERLRNIVLVPCGHMALCKACAGGVIAGSNECPMCRETIIDHCVVAHDDA